MQYRMIRMALLLVMKVSNINDSNMKNKDKEKDMPGLLLDISKVPDSQNPQQYFNLVKTYKDWIIDTKPNQNAIQEDKELKGIN